MNTKNNAPLNALRHHVSGAIARGEAVAITEVPQSKHTPGTWTYNAEFSAVVVVHDYKLKAVADFGKTDLPETEENALLMAASKELLEALQGLLIAAQRMPQPVTHDGLELADKLAQARIAIRKATTKPAL